MRNPNTHSTHSKASTAINIYHQLTLLPLASSTEDLLRQDKKRSPQAPLSMLMLGCADPRCWATPSAAGGKGLGSNGAGGCSSGRMET